MKLIGNSGKLLEAEFLLEGAEGERLDVVLQSAGGTGGSASSRNRDYPLVLKTLLERLRLVDALLEDAVVDSQRTRTLPRSDRRIQPKPWEYPIPLQQVEDFEVLRKALTRPQGNIGSTGRGGNERKRIRMTFAVLSRADLGQVKQVLQAVEADAPRRSDITAGLTAADINSALAEWQRVGRDAFFERYGGRQAQKYLILVGSDEFDAMAVLRGARALRGLDTSGPFRGDRRAVADPLRSMGFVVDDPESDLEGPLGPDPSPYVAWTGSFSGETDGMTLRSYRREQRILRGALGIGTGDPDRVHQCGICGLSVPERLLAAAHIKPRRDCTDEERRDMSNIAMAACTLGCDALYEYGYLTVQEGGQLLTDHTASVDLHRFHGRIAPAWNRGREPYFAWHRANRFRLASKQRTCV
ncbi:hypothetical protein [Kribbella soli]|uniref:ScoMcrA-like N-terminal head domain-containing protein n=1 Tax=Kribbella soli TaxID=1124743 RepID=A0A4R0HHW4_9ACTN|nr:hypothetical protein [Kribbella soli]TCC10895.1 hypothetical protein E0H45_06220 [Kribbella soli]